MLKEFWVLVKMFFASKPSEIEKAKVYDMKHFPFEGYKAMSWCGYIIHRIGASAVDEVTINHETIHLMQAKDCGSWWKYYLSYLWNWIRHNPLIAPASACYYVNKFEAQAYANEDNFEYCSKWDPEAIEKYKIDNAKDVYKRIGRTPAAWKEYIKTL